MHTLDFLHLLIRYIYLLFFVWYNLNIKLKGDKKMTVAVKKTINIELTPSLYNQLKKLADDKSIGSMRSFCCEAISEKIIAFEKLRKENLMKQAANDPGYIERCEEVCKDFAATDYPGGTDEW